MSVAAKVLLALSLSAQPACAGWLPGVPPPPESQGRVVGHIFAGIGGSMPFGGHWGDRTSGFNSSPALSLAVSKRVDELFSYGLDSFHAWHQTNRASGGLNLKLTSLTPFVKVSVPEGAVTYYGTVGLGVYRWAYPAFISAGAVQRSDSAWNGGFNLGAGVLFPAVGNSRAGLELRWHRIFNMRAAAFRLGAVNSLNLALVVRGDLHRRRP